MKSSSAGLASIVINHLARVCVLCILAMATFRGQHLFVSSFQSRAGGNGTAGTWPYRFLRKKNGVAWILI